MIKKYLRPEQAAKYLADKTGDVYSSDDIVDLANEGLISIVVYFDGGVTDFQSITFEENLESEEYFDEDRVIQIYRFEGYLKSRELIRFVNYSGWQKMPYPIDIYEPIETNYSKDELLTYGVFATKYKYSATFRDTDNYPAMFDASNHLFVPRQHLDNLIKNYSQQESENINYKNQDKCVEPIAIQDDAQSETANLVIIGALLALLKIHHPRKTQESWIYEIEKMKNSEYPHARALSESQLKKVFAIANKSVKELKKQ